VVHFESTRVVHFESTGDIIFNVERNAMAVIFNLGIDCGHSAEVAEAAVRHFDGFVIPLRHLSPAHCRVHQVRHRERWYVEVWPDGMGMATTRPELLSAEAEIISALYERLRMLSGFSRALFGGEAFDWLRGDTPEEDANVDCTNLIYREVEFSAPPVRSLQRFSNGYVIVGARP
jgi:hypothetical protein